MLQALAPLLLLAPGLQEAPESAAPDAVSYVVPGPEGPVERRVDRDAYATWLLENRGRARGSGFALAIAVERLAAERGVQCTDDRARAIVQEQLDERVRLAFDGDRAAWLQEVASLGRTPEGIVASRAAMVRVDELAMGVLAQDFTVGPQDVERAWEETYGPRGHRIEVRGLALSLELPPADEEVTMEQERERREAHRQARLAEAEALRERAVAGESFTRLVYGNSVDKSRREGGLMPGTVTRGSWPGTTIDELLELEVGGVTTPFEARGHVWLLEVHSISVTPLEEVAEALEAELIERGPGTAQLAAFLADLRARVSVEFSTASFEEDAAEALRSGTLRVDGQPVPLRDFATWLMRTEGETYVPEFVSRLRIEELAAAEEIEITPAELDERIDAELRWTLELGFKGRKELWLNRLAAAGSNEAQWRIEVGRKLLSQLRAERLMMKNRVITEEDARSLFLERYGPSGERIDARYIVFDLGIEPRGEEESPRAWKDRLAKAAEPLMPTFAELAERYDEGEDFASLVQRYSQDDATKRTGGRPANGFDESVLPEDVRIALRSLPLGTLSEPQVVGSRAFFFEVVRRVEVKYEDLKDALMQELSARPPDAARVASYINTLTQRARPTVLPGLWL